MLGQASSRGRRREKRLELIGLELWQPLLGGLCVDTLLLLVVLAGVRLQAFPSCMKPLQVGHGVEGERVKRSRSGCSHKGEAGGELPP